MVFGVVDIHVVVLMVLWRTEEKIFVVVVGWLALHWFKVIARLLDAIVLQIL